MRIRTSNSFNHFIDTNVLLGHANDESGQYSADIETILREATGENPRRNLWVSNVLFAELRPSYLKSNHKFSDITELSRYIRSIATVIGLDVNINLRAARLRDLAWKRPDSMPNEKRRCMTLGDALHISSALYTKEALGVPDLEFLTFDNSSSSSTETDPETKALPILSIEDYMDGLYDNADAKATAGLIRIKPILPNTEMDLRGGGH